MSSKRNDWWYESFVGRTLGFFGAWAAIILALPLATAAMGGVIVGAVVKMALML